MGIAASSPRQLQYVVQDRYSLWQSHDTMVHLLHCQLITSLSYGGAGSLSATTDTQKTSCIFTPKSMISIDSSGVIVGCPLSTAWLVIDESGYKQIWRCRWRGLELELFLFCVYKELHVSGQMDVCHAHKAATSAYTLLCDDDIRVRRKGVNQMSKHVGGRYVNKEHSTRINNEGAQQVTKCFPNREKSHIQRLEMLIEGTFRQFVLTRRKDSGHTPRA